MRKPRLGLGTAFAISLLSSMAFAATVNVTGFAAYQSFETSAGTAFTADSTGTVTSVTVGTDLSDMLASGGRVLDSALCPSANGLFPTQFALLDGRNSDGSVLAASAAAGKFGVTAPLGTALFLVSEAANSNTKTDTVLFDAVLPRNYIAGQNITLTANAKYVLGSGTVGTHTMTCHAYKTEKDGSQSADLIATGALTVPTTPTDLVSTITGTGLSPNDRLAVTCVGVIQDSGASNIFMNLNSMTLN